MNSYDEEYPWQAIELHKYSGKTRIDEEVGELLDSSALEPLLCSQEDADSTIRIICVTLEALEADAQWMSEILVLQVISKSVPRRRRG